MSLFKKEFDFLFDLIRALFTDIGSICFTLTKPSPKFDIRLDKLFLILFGLENGDSFLNFDIKLLSELFAIKLFVR